MHTYINRHGSCPITCHVCLCNTDAGVSCDHKGKSLSICHDNTCLHGPWARSAAALPDRLQLTYRSRSPALGAEGFLQAPPLQEGTSTLESRVGCVHRRVCTGMPQAGSEGTHSPPRMCRAGRLHAHQGERARQQAVSGRTAHMAGTPTLWTQLHA